MSTAQPAVLIVEARFYEDIADALAQGAIAALERQGQSYERVQVPGAFEIPSVVRYAIGEGASGAPNARYSGFISLGCVIRGETDHYDHVCRESIRALMDLSMRYAIAHGLGILTVENHTQAVVRADPDGKDCGGRAAEACLRMIALQKRFQVGS